MLCLTLSLSSSSLSPLSLSLSPSLPPSSPPSLFLPFPLTHTGLRGTYQGLTATIIKQGSNQAIRFFVYTNLKRHLQGGDNSKDIGNIRTFFIGGIAGAASVFGNTPVDVVKTRMQGLEAHKYKNTWDCVVKIAKNEGYRA